MKKQKIEGELVYNKHNSFVSFRGKFNEKVEKIKIKKRINSIYNNKIGINNLKSSFKGIIDKVITDLNKDNKNESFFSINENIIDEINTLDDKQILNYLVHRYRYEIYPKLKILDDYPPYLQIEPTSICNYRCVFCFETDKSFTNKNNGFMGNMPQDLFKQIIDEAEGNIEFLSIASRGEPLACPDISSMLKYTIGKFLNLKLNTNASLLNEKKCHAILAGGVRTVVFSADAADEKLYSKLRVNGKLSKVLRNIEQFQKIRETQYPKSLIISRVSGVKFSDEQNFDSMKNLWNGLVDQVAFVEYNPWENSYVKPSNNIMTPCSDLWRRMFIWWDGKANPCDVDYKSLLTMGNYPKKTLKELWRSESYKALREKHLTKKRNSIKPCSSCVVI